MFNIDIDERRQLLSITLRGLMDEAEAHLFIQVLQCAFVRQIGAKPYVMILDTTQFNIQCQSVVALLGQRIAVFPSATKIALVNGKSLVRMQLKRVLTRDYARYFETIAEALPWLLDQWPPAAQSLDRSTGHGVGHRAAHGTALYRVPPPAVSLC